MSVILSMYLSLYKATVTFPLSALVKITFGFSQMNFLIIVEALIKKLSCGVFLRMKLDKLLIIGNDLFLIARRIPAGSLSMLYSTLFINSIMVFSLFIIGQKFSPNCKRHCTSCEICEDVKVHKPLILYLRNRCKWLFKGTRIENCLEDGGWRL